MLTLLYVEVVEEIHNLVGKEMLWAMWTCILLLENAIADSMCHVAREAGEIVENRVNLSGSSVVHFKPCL